MIHENRVLKNHVKRLLDQNRELSEALAEERILRKAAWKTHWDRINSGFFSRIRMLCDLNAGHDKAKRTFDKETFRNVG